MVKLRFGLNLFAVRVYYSETTQQNVKMKRTAMILMCLATMLTATAQEQIESPIVSEKDSAYYVNQEHLWKQVTQEQPTNGNAWRNLYQAANYQQWFGQRNDAKLSQILDDMGKAIPQDYNFFWCMYKNKVGSDESFEWAEKALKCLPEDMSFFDYDMWTGYLMMRFDETRLAELCQRYYQSGLYSPGILQYNYNEMQGMDEGGIYFGNGDACLIPKAILQYGKGVHKDKLVVCMSFLAIPDYREKLLARLGIDAKLFQYEQPKTEEEYDRQEREFIDLILQHTKRPVYFSTLNGVERNAPWEKQLYNEGLTLRYSTKKYDNFSVKRRNVEERYLMEYLLEQFTPDHWITSDRLSANYAVLLSDLLAWYKTHDERRYKWLMRLLMNGIDRTDLPQERKEEFRKQLQ